MRLVLVATSTCGRPVGLRIRATTAYGEPVLVLSTDLDATMVLDASQALLVNGVLAYGALAVVDDPLELRAIHAVERGDVSASQATANVAVDTGVALGAGVAGAAAGAAVGSFVPGAGTAVGAGLGFLAGAGTSIGLGLLAEHTGFSGWAKDGLGEQLGAFEDPLNVMWSGINGTIDGAKTGVMAGATGGAAMGAIGTGLTGAALGFMAGGPLGALAGGIGGAAIGAGGGALIGGGFGLIPGAGIGMGMGVANGLADWLLPSADAEAAAGIAN